MSKVKKLLAIVLSLAMIMGMSLTTFAADNIIGNNDDVGTITVNGITPEDGITVTAYQIVEAQYDETTKIFTGYHALYDSIDDSGNIQAPDDINQDVLNGILADIRGENPTVTPARSYPMSSEDGATYTAEVPVGTYLVVIENAETKVYNPVVISVSYVNASGENSLSEGIVGITANNNAWVKVSDVPGIDKSVSDTSGDTEENTNGNSVNVGDTLTYNVTIDPIPNYGGDYPVLNVVDTLSDGLTYANTEQDPLTVVVDKAAGQDVTLEEDTDYTLTISGQTITVNFVVNGNYTLNEYVGESVVITYKATVNENAVVNEDGNSNNATLNYTTDSKTNGNDGDKEDKTYTYTFDIDGNATGTNDIITKVGEDEQEEALDGAVFGLYTDSECTQPYTNDSGTLTNHNGEYASANTVTSDAEGQLYISGLAAGTYYLKELTAPNNYSVNTHVFEIVISATYNPNGTLASWKVTIDGTEAASFTVDHTSGAPSADSNITGIDIQNTKLSSLPSTGGIGTTIFTIGGCAIMIAAAGLYFASRRKQENK